MISAVIEDVEVRLPDRYNSYSQKSKDAIFQWIQLLKKNYGDRLGRVTVDRVLKQDSDKPRVSGVFSFSPAVVKLDAQSSSGPAGFRRVLPVHIPTVGYKGRDTTDAKAFRTAADKLILGYDVGGSNMRAAVARLLRGAAEALDKAGQPDPEWSYWDYQHGDAS